MIILIHSYDYIPDYILDALQSRISEEFKIRVWTGHEELPMSEENHRSQQEMLDRYIFKIVDDYAENRTRDYFNILQILEIDNTVDLTYREKYDFVHYLYDQSENGQKIWPDLINRMNPQYNAEILRNELKRAYRRELEKPNVIGVLHRRDTPDHSHKTKC